MPHFFAEAIVNKIIVANGVNLDLCGQREAQLYGNFTLAQLETYLRLHADRLCPLWGCGDCRLVFFQTNCEHKFLSEISKPWRGALLNPGAWTHTSLALGDRLASLSLQFVEVHISPLARRARQRQRSYSAPYAIGVVSGFGMDSYLAALVGLLSHLQRVA